jgi:hypothetical protein
MPQDLRSFLMTAILILLVFVIPISAAKSFAIIFAFLRTCCSSRP